MENVVTAIFKVGSQGYQAFSEVKRDPFSESYLISELALVRKQSGHISLQESVHTGFENTIMGGLMGGLVGVLGGPIGMLLDGGIGFVAGSAADTRDEARNLTMAEKVTASMNDGDVALIALVQEGDPSSLDLKLKAYNALVIRQDAATIQDEIDEAARIQKELAKQVKKDLRAQKSAEWKASIEKRKVRIKQAFDEFKQRLPK
jgi:hypothetical protein